MVQRTLRDFNVLWKTSCSSKNKPHVVCFVASAFAPLKLLLTFRVRHGSYVISTVGCISIVA